MVISPTYNFYYFTHENESFTLYFVQQENKSFTKNSACDYNYLIEDFYFFTYLLFNFLIFFTADEASSGVYLS